MSNKKDLKLVGKVLKCVKPGTTVKVNSTSGTFDFDARINEKYMVIKENSKTLLTHILPENKNQKPSKQIYKISKANLGFFKDEEKD